MDVSRTVGQAGMQVSEPRGLKVYGGHGWHVSPKLPAGLKVPSGHTSGVEVVAQVCPGGHMHAASEALA